MPNVDAQMMLWAVLRNFSVELHPSTTPKSMTCVAVGPSLDGEKQRSVQDAGDLYHHPGGAHPRLRFLCSL
jgi:hypothetical protein